MARVILSEQTADRIRQLIERQYKPGDRIPAEMELAEFLGVSRTTIREAVKILCSRNILEIRRGHGTFVCENPGLPADPFGSKDMDEEQLKADIFEMSSPGDGGSAEAIRRRGIYSNEGVSQVGYRFS